MRKFSLIDLTRALAVVASSASLAGTAVAAPHRKQDPSTTPPPAAQEDKRVYQVGPTWVLKSVNDKPSPVHDQPTFTVDSSYRGFGFSGCNTWSATIYPVKHQKFLVGPIAVTKKQCDKPTMDFEAAFLSYIHSGPNWDLDNGELVMKGQGGTMRFERSL